MKAMELLKIIYKDCKDWEDRGFAVAYPTKDLSEAIEELEELQENKLLVKMNQEMIKLRKQNQDLLNTIIEAQKAIENILERNK